MNTPITLVVPLSLIATVNSLCFAIAGQAAGENMLRANVNESGPCKEVDATHAVSSGVIDADMVALMADPAAIVEKSGGASTLEQITELLAACDISQDSIPAALDRVYGRTPVVVQP